MKTGFARLDITPPLGTFLIGNATERYADGIITPLEINAVAFSDEKNTAVAISIDLVGIPQKEMDEIRHLAAEKNNLPPEAIFLACTHIHTGPMIRTGEADKHCDPAYVNYVYKKISDSVTLAIADLKETKAEIARGDAKGISFIRRFRMKDGTTRTNPFDDPNVVGPIGTPDETVQLVKLVRDSGDDIYIINFQVHPDVLTVDSGTKICADYPGFVRETLESALPGIKAVFFNGAQGDTNHINRVNYKYGLKHSLYMGRVIAGTVLSICTYAEEVDADKVFFGQLNIDVPFCKGSPDEVAKAKALYDAYEKQGDKVLSPGMLGTTELYEARKFITLENAPDYKELHITSVGFGDVAFIGFPGEPFTDIGRGVKNGSPFAMTIPCCCANGSEGYYPMKEAFDEGGYEARTSKYKAGVAEALIDGGIKLAKKLKG